MINLTNKALLTFFVLAISMLGLTGNARAQSCGVPAPGQPDASGGSGGGGQFASGPTIQTDVRIIYFANHYPDGVMRFNLRLEVSNRSDGTGLSGHGIIGVVSRPQYTGFVGNLRYNFYGGSYQGQGVGFLGIEFYDTNDNLVASVPFNEIVNQGNYNIYTLSGNQSSFFSDPGAVLPYNNFDLLNDRIGINGFVINAGNISSSGGSGTFNTSVNGGTASFSCTTQLQPPVITSFTASPATICAGASSTLTWTSTSGASASITDLTTGTVTSVPVNGSLSVTPPSTRTYRLTVTNAAGSATSDVSVTLTPLAAINSYSASATTINAGQSTNLNYNVSNTTSRSITDLTTGTITTLGTESGSLSVTPPSTRTYRLTASNGCNTLTQDITITVIQPPSISSFTASVSPVCSGSSSTLSWSASGGSSATISGPGLPGSPVSVNPNSGSLVVNPTSTTTYTLTVTNSAGSVTSTTTVTVTPAPAISSFTASATTINAGQSTTLSWATSGGTSATITDLATGTVTSVGLNSSLLVTPPTSRTYRLTLTGTCGTVTQDLAITVNQAPPTITTLSASPATICAGQSTTLTWTSTGGTSASITDLTSGSVTSVPVNGSLAVSPASSRSYRLTVTNAGGSVTQDVAVTVNPLAVINSFSGTPTTINAGQSTTLSFNVSNTTSRTITDLSTGVVTTLGAESGSQVFSPATTRTYRLTAVNGCNTVTQDITITVIQPPVITSFSSNVGSVCSGGGATLSWTASGGSSATISGPGLPGSPVSVNPNSGSLVVNPTSTTTYTLTVTNSAGSVTSTTTVTVTPAPSISSFTASATTINAGQSTTLSWASSNGTSATITDLATGTVTSVPVNGSLLVTPATTRTYRLTINGTCGTVTQDITITVTQAPVISGFSASPAALCSGDSSTLTWSASGGTSATISAPGMPGSPVSVNPNSGSLIVFPTSTTTYTLTVTNASGSDTLTVTVTVIPPATVDAFTASPSTINAGQSSTLSWSSSNGSTATITDLATGIVTTVGLNTSLVVTPPTTRTYRLTISGPCGTDTRDVTITVNQPPSISSFSASPTTICAGASTTLSWASTGGTSASITDLTSGTVTSVPLNGSLSVTPATSRSYRLTVTNAAGSVTQDLAVTVTQLAVINSFSASATTINAGQSTTLSFNVSNTTSRSITDLSTGVVTTLGAQSGSQAFSPATTRTYRLTAVNGCNTVTQDITVSVNQPPSISSFTASASPICAGQSSTLSWSASGGTSATISGPGLPGSPVSVNPNSGTLVVSPASTTTYTLTVTNAAGSVTSNVTVTVTPNGISSFTASSSSIIQGQSTTLSYTTVNTTSVTITDLSTGTVTTVAVPNGSLVVTPPTTRTYRLTATGSCGTATQDITITVTPCQTISSFSASATTINAGQSTTLSYTLTGATSATITDLQTGTVTGVPVQSGSLVVSPATSRSYRLTVVGPCATLTQDIAITVNQPPTINSFAASATNICPGQSSTLSWTTSGATSASITDLSTGAVTSVAVNGSLVVSPATTRTYRLTATNAVGSVTQNVVITVTQPPTIASFTQSANNVESGAEVDLSWSATGSSANITDLSDGSVVSVPLTGVHTVTPTQTTTYRLTVVNGCGTETRDVTITVISPPTITSFSASVSPACEGQSVTLSWSATGGDNATITGSPTQLPGGPASVNPAGGTLVVQPTETTTYTLSVYKGSLSTENNSATATVTVTVIPSAAIVSYTASNMVVGPGQSTVLSYSLTNAAAATITDLTTGTVTTVPIQTGSLTVTPATSRIYRLTVAGDCGAPITRDIGISVSSCQFIDNFGASLATVAAGQSTVLSWSTTSGSSATITDLSSGTVTPVGLGGTLTVTPASTRTYRLTVSGACANVTQDVTITVTSCQVITSFSASPPTMNVGGGTTLSWTVNGTSATITDLNTGETFPVDVPSGSLDLTPTETTVYRLTVQSACGTATQDLTVTVIKSPVITRFTIAPSPICQGQDATLMWNSTGGTTAIITGPDLPGSPVWVIPDGGTLIVRPPRTTTYTLTVFNDNISDPDNNYAAKSVSASITVPGATPIFDSFTATPSSIGAGQSTTLSWATQHTSSVDIIDLATNTTIATGRPATDTLVVTPAFSRSYRALAHNGTCASNTQDVAVTVAPCPAVAGSTFTASPSALSQGDSSTLSWSVPNATSVTISGVTGTFGATGSVTVTPSTTTTYTLTASGAGSCAPVTLQQTVTVAATGSVLLGPKSQPAAVGPTDNNDDTTNMSQTVGIAAPEGGVTSLPGVVTFTNTIQNTGTSSDTFTLRATTIPAGFTVEVNAGAGFVSLNGGATTTMTVAPGAAIDIPVRITAPAGITVLTGFPTVLRATSSITPSAFNETIDRFWTGFVRAVKGFSVTNSTGVGTAGDAVPGAVIEYILNYTNVVPPSGGIGNVDLTATNVTITENGNAAPNNWGTLTTHVPASASDTRGGTITGDVTGSSLLIDMISTLPPGQSGVFRFRRIIN